MMMPRQFWILMAASSLVTFLLIVSALLARDLDRKQRILVDCQEISATSSAYEEAWKQLIVKVYQIGHDDPEMLDLIKSEGVKMNDDSTPTAPATPSMPSVPAKAPILPTNPPSSSGTPPAGT
jgi:hypothetical protein